jgi:hypothetical protein
MTATTADGMEFARLAIKRADQAHESALGGLARQDTHEATDKLIHDQLDGDIKDCRKQIDGIQREIKHATWALMFGMASLIGTVIAKGHLF